jgi:hypothetical protein
LGIVSEGVEIMKDYTYRGIPVERHKWIYDLYKDIDEHFANGFVYGSLIQDKGRCFIAVSAMARTNEYSNNGVASLVEVEPSTVGMYMMCIDKHANLIFEGDIVRYTEEQGVISKYYYGEKPYIPNRTFTVEMIPSVFAEVYHNCYDLEIIGNIHQEVK